MNTLACSGKCGVCTMGAFCGSAASFKYKLRYPWQRTAGVGASPKTMGDASSLYNTIVSVLSPFLPAQSSTSDQNLIAIRNARTQLRSNHQFDSVSSYEIQNLPPTDLVALEGDIQSYNQNLQYQIAAGTYTQVGNYVATSGQILFWAGVIALGGYFILRK